MKNPTMNGLLVLAAAVLTSVGPRDATATPCKADGEICRTNRSCCGSRGNDGVCVKSSNQRFGLCCTRIGQDTNCDRRDDDCDGVADDGYVATPTTCGVGTCASTGDLVCESGALRDTCNVGATDGSSCSDESVCTVADVCSAGECTGTRIPSCCDTDQDCTAPDTCGGGGTPNVCGCVPITCGAADCGEIPDGCGGTLTCPCVRCRGFCTDGNTSISTVCGRDQELLCAASGSSCFDVCEEECQEHAGVGCDSASCIPCEP
jgi:hypothetical protein